MRYCRKFLYLIFVFAVIFPSLQAQSFSTKPLIPEIKTLQVIADDDFMKLPVIVMGEGRRETGDLEISFDYLGDEQPWLAYRLVHCDADWQEDELDQMDFADGFLPVRITDVRPSFNTFISYFHYSISFPNDDVQLTASGNYALLVHPEGEEDNILAVATFSVCEQLAFVKGEISPNTDIDFKKSHQQVNLEVTWANSKLPYLDPINELRVMVSQNRRRETRREVKVPARLETGRAVYEHNRDLIFPAGNNYRRFEFTDERYAGLGVYEVRYQPPYYVATINLDKQRKREPYRFDKDQNGRFLVHALKVDDEATEAEYFKAMFTLNTPFSGGREPQIFLDGDFTYGQKTEEFEMYFDEDAQIFCNVQILKQGAYNYQYLVDGGTSEIEGDFYETENEYDIYIYYHPGGARYDRLIGVAKIE